MPSQKDFTFPPPPSFAAFTASKKKLLQSDKSYVYSLFVDL